MFLTVCEKLHFPAPATEALQSAYAVLAQDPALAQAARLFLTDGGQPTEVLQGLSEKHSVPLATVTAVALVEAVPGLLELYRQKDIDEKICWDTLVDLRCKLIENHDVEGVWGAEAIVWYCRVFTGKILKLGRLEYEPMVYKWDTIYADVPLGQPVLNIHIPSCGSLPLEEVIESLKLATDFFHTNVFICASWMLYPPMCEAVLSKESNLYKFYKCFDIVEHYPTPDNHHFWRIFGQKFTPETYASAPTDTTLRRNLLSWMLEGNDMGIGRGAFLFDGKEIQHFLP